MTTLLPPYGAIKRRHLTREEIRRIDRKAINEYGMSGLVLMENAGRGCADKLCELGVYGKVVIVCGKGNNAGDGFVIARHLEARGYDVRVLLATNGSELHGDAAANYEILKNASTPLVSLLTKLGRLDSSILKEELAGANWVVDALLGTGAIGDPRPHFADILTQLNNSDARKLAVDLPSGMDCDTGRTASCTFRAGHTCTFVAPKIGFVQASPDIGTLHVIDIGVPKKLLLEYGLDEIVTK